MAIALLLRPAGDGEAQGDRLFGREVRVMSLPSGPDQFLVAACLFLSMLSVGLQPAAGDLASLFGFRSQLTRPFVANFVLLPVLGITLAAVFPVERPVAAAMILLACVPGGLSASLFKPGTGCPDTTIRCQDNLSPSAEAALAASLAVQLPILGAMVSPAILRLVLPAYVDLAIPFARVFGFLAGIVVLPLFLGLGLRKAAPRSASTVSKVVALVSLVLFAVFLLLTRSARFEALASIGGWAAGAMVLFVLGSLALGWAMGGPTREARAIVASFTSMRNLAFCLALAVESPRKEVILPPLIAYAALIVPPNLLLALVGAWRRHRFGRRSLPPVDGVPPA